MSGKACNARVSSHKREPQKPRFVDIKFTEISERKISDGDPRFESFDLGQLYLSM